MAKKKTILNGALGETLFYPLITEKSVAMIESQNKLGFVVRDSASKEEVKKAVEKRFGVRVVNVNVLRDRKGRKKAFVKLDAKFKASDIAIKLGVI